MGFEISDKKKILLISSGTPFSTASKMVMDMIDALSLGGYDVTFLTKYKDTRFKGKMYGILDQVDGLRSVPIYKRIFIRLKYFIFRILSVLYNLKVTIPEYYFLDKYDDCEILLTDSFLETVGASSRYDKILLFATHNMVSFRNIESLYYYYKCPIIIAAPDMYPFTGGCHYFNDCRRFEVDCGKCPALLSYNERDCSNRNALYKKKVYNNCNITLLCNTFMLNFARKSSVVSERQLRHSYPVINECIFKPCDDRAALRDKYNIPKDCFLIFVGATTIKEKRKGYIYLEKSVNEFVSRLLEKERENIILCVAGRTSIDISRFSVNVKFVGYLSYQQLAEYFAMSDIHISSTIQDAGPMMVNQSISCGTPVVCFNIGTAIDVIKNYETGYAANLYDTKGLAMGIEYFYKLSSEERHRVSKLCRNMAIETTSYSAFVRNIESISPI